MSATKIIKQRLQDINMTQIELSNKAGMTRQNLNNKLSRDNFTAQELQCICNILGMKLSAIDDNGKEYTIEYKSE